MKNTLSTIQKLFKAGKIISTIVFICCVVGAGFSLLAAIVLAAFGTSALALGAIEGIADLEAGGTVAQAVCVMLCWMVVTIAQAVVAKFAEIYFKNELDAGTPFTFDGAKEMFRLGILSLALPIGAGIVVGIIQGILELLQVGTGAVEIDTGLSVGLGAMFMVMSLICRYGAEIREEHRV